MLIIQYDNIERKDCTYPGSLGASVSPGPQSPVIKLGERLRCKTYLVSGAYSATHPLRDSLPGLPRARGSEERERKLCATGLVLWTVRRERRRRARVEGARVEGEACIQLPCPVLSLATPFSRSPSRALMGFPTPLKWNLLVPTASFDSNYGI